MAWLDKLAFWASETLYEKPKLYRLNPCDVDCFRPLKPFGRAFQMLSAQCLCCNGARLAAAIIITSIFPTAAVIGLGVIYALLFAYAVLHPEEPSDENLV